MGPLASKYEFGINVFVGSEELSCGIAIMPCLHLLSARMPADPQTIKK